MTPTQLNTLSAFLGFTTGEREIPKVRAEVFFRLKQGEIITYADGEDKKVQFSLQKIHRQLSDESNEFSKVELEANFDRIYREAKSIFQ